MAGWSAIIIHGNDVEAPLARKCQVAQIVAGHGGEGALLVAIPSCFGGLEIPSGAGFHFDEAQHVPVAASLHHDAVTESCAPPSRTHGGAGRSTRLLLLLGRCADAQGAFPQEASFGQPIKSSHGSAGETAGEHQAIRQSHRRCRKGSSDVTVVTS